MRKIIFLVMGLVLAMNLCACGCTNNAPATTPSTTNAPTTRPNQNTTVTTPSTNIPDNDIGPTLSDGGIVGDNSNGTTGKSRSHIMG